MIPRAGLLSVGDELLGGRTVNTNAAFIAQRLGDRGILVSSVETVGDDEFAIADGIKSLCARADLVIVSGGLGATPDDVTREALAGAAGTLLAPDARLKREIAKKTGGRTPRRNARMARIPEGAIAFPNPLGVAAGLRVDVGGTPVYALPGVPMELEAILEASVLPDLERTFLAGAPLPKRVLRIFGLREAEVADKLGDLLARGATPSVGVTVRDGLISITMLGAGADERAEAIREVLGKHVFGEDEETPATAALRALRDRGWTLGIAESVTGGLLAGRFVDEPGASDALLAAVVTYGDEAKHEILGVPKTVLKRESSVSEEVARRMARGARKWLGVDVAIATTGVAGPGPDARGNPAGLCYVALATPPAGKRGETVRKLRIRGERNAVRRRCVWSALDLLRRQLAK